MGFEDVVLGRGNFAAGFVDGKSQKMIVEVLSDPARVGVDADAELVQIVSRPDPGKQEKVRRSDRAGADDDLGCGIAGMQFAVVLIDDAFTSSVLDHEPMAARAGLDSQIATIVRGYEESQSNVATTAVAHRRGIGIADADEFRARKIVINWMAGVDRSLDKSVGQRIGMGVAKDRKRATDAVIMRCAAVIVLRFPEIGQHTLVIPAGVAEIGPVVVIGRCAADVDRTVEAA